MSLKSKDLAYNAKEPAFLQRIRGIQAGSGIDADRHERPIARPGRLTKSGNDEDDAPTYVVEDSGNTLSKEEYEALLAKETQPDGEEGKNGTVVDKFADAPVTTKQDAGPAQADAIDEKVAARTKQDVTEVGGAQKKRKAARVVGGAEESGEADDKDEDIPKATKKMKKKVKPVKLSFGD